MTQIASDPPRQKAGRVKDSDYMGYIAALGSEQGAGCIICGVKPCQVCHFRGGEPCDECGGESAMGDSNFCFPCEDCDSTGYRYGKVPAMKNDRFVLPMCPECHMNGPESQHSTNERLWWAARQIDPLAVMKRLQDIYDSNPLPRALELGTEAVMEVRR